ncbi:uncharacterized protein LOC128983123 [Macrosteles quadrilineatus]|uniref:uncharacterized protein LOC128983123 n=1 Tax=Macrosteles quadrilineatus TaxID=74068 RepID=UPI0023E1EA57|nr:uncharacterized protein LOC128983123 [Macrosteles quadrilineatus]
MSTLNIFSWIWISLFCELLFRALSGIFKCHKAIKDTPGLDGLENENDKTNFEIKPRKSRCFYKKCKRGLAGLSEEFKSMFSKKDENNFVSEDDPLVKDGLRREDKFVNGGNVKVSSYYDQNGKMVFQRETVLPPPTVNDIRNNNKDLNNPPFFIKPQEASTSDGIKNIDDKIDETFGKIYGVAKELEDSQKTFIDEHINKTFKDINDMVLPSVF